LSIKRQKAENITESLEREKFSFLSARELCKFNLIDVGKKRESARLFSLTFGKQAAQVSLSPLSVTFLR
jgi:hypothetical protein